MAVVGNCATLTAGGVLASTNELGVVSSSFTGLCHLSLLFVAGSFVDARVGLVVSWAASGCVAGLGTGPEGPGTVC